MVTLSPSKLLVTGILSLIKTTGDNLALSHTIIICIRYFEKAKASCTGKQFITTEVYLFSKDFKISLTNNKHTSEIFINKGTISLNLINTDAILVLSDHVKGEKIHCFLNSFMVLLTLKKCISYMQKREWVGSGKELATDRLTQ